MCQSQGAYVKTALTTRDTFETFSNLRVAFLLEEQCFHTGRYPLYFP